ncbi:MULTISPECIES: triose-phosphate isomerase [Actinomadura]|jgi:triosephosphate isomerase|uniref:Triosephosphate isomerase n=1 Tax=Actinomadura citrea TaxID=46158 RepID=A0A7Y9GDL2_9ACTN|nr:triose-phosphate isomerase [Actinomadura citrea]NYE14426.1 triosephosphate isomerase [Actinomadura citrea]GGT78887.1 triosephosphate isomerase [Actinomadura citrea]
MARATPAGGPSGRKPLMAGNWKMNNNHLEAIALVQKMAFALKDADYEAVDVAVLPPFTALRSVQTLIEADKYGIQYGAQDVSQHASGAYTGEISAAMLAKLGCTYAVVGHSERRQYHAEDDAVVNAKAKAALAADLTPILCVGEGLEVRKAGGHVPHVLAQIDGGLEKITADQVRRSVIAYEPVWAIGTGEVATPQDAQEVCSAIRTRLAELYDGGVADEARILYGGSVKGGNVAGIMAQTDVDGALVGGASLDPGEFVKICRYRDLPV